MGARIHHGDKNHARGWGEEKQGRNIRYGPPTRSASGGCNRAACFPIERMIVCIKWREEVRMITAQDVRELLAQRPFEPFRIVTSSGQHYDIPHSDFVL